MIGIPFCCLFIVYGFCSEFIYFASINMSYKPDHHNIRAKLMVKLADFEKVKNYKKKLQCALDAEVMYVNDLNQDASSLFFWSVF